MGHFTSSVLAEINGFDINTSNLGTPSAGAIIVIQISSAAGPLTLRPLSQLLDAIIQSGRCPCGNGNCQTVWALYLY